MSIRKETKTMYVTKDGVPVCVEDGTIYVTTRDEATALSTARLVQGSVLFVIRTGQMYMLEEDGGVWRNVATGSALTEESA